MSVSVTIVNNDLNRAIQKFLGKNLAVGVEVALREMAIEIVDQILTRWPSDTGRSAAGWRAARDELANGVDGSSVSTTNEPNVVLIEVTNLVDYSAMIEYGTAETPPTNLMVLAMEAARRRLTFGRGPNSLGEQIRGAWEEATTT